jgi:hypothetical protein
MREERMNGERQFEPAVQRSSFFLDRHHGPDGRAAKQDADLTSLPRSVPERSEQTGKSRGRANEFGKLVEDEQERLISADGGERVEDVIPVAEGAALQVPESSRHDRRREPGEDP